MHGDVAFVIAFEKGIDGGGGGLFGVVDQFLDPDDLLTDSADFDLDDAALVVGSVFADGLAAGAETLDGNAHGEGEVVTVGIPAGLEAAFVVHEGLLAGNRGGALHEVGESDFGMGGFGFEALAHDGEQTGEGLDRDFPAVLVEDFDEATHVGALDLGREVDGETEGGRHLLGLLGPVEDGDGIPEVTDSDAVEGHAPFVHGVLEIGKCGGGRTGGGCAHERVG